MNIEINTLMKQSGVNFGTSGVRGLVVDMTDKVCFAYVTAFLQFLTEQHHLTAGSQVAIAGDLRTSTPRIIKAAIAACESKGLAPVFCGYIPSPAVALFGLQQQIPTMMVTGSHIPDDRNGIKFNTPKGEILKADEVNIRQQIVTLNDDLFDHQGNFVHKPELPPISQAAYDSYIQRYVDFFPAQCLKHKQIGLYEHSSVGREVFKTILEQLGATVTSLGRSEAFISVDTEAIRPEDTQAALEWAAQHEFDCLVSTDGDADRPLISDEKGNWLRGDIAGILCADYLGAETVITPVSSNTAVEKSQLFKQVIRTRIGSPYVIEAMQAAEKRQPNSQIVGYEANGGFLQQTALTKSTNTLSPLPTRDAIIVALTVMMSAFERRLTISALLSELPARYTYSDRLKNFPTTLSQTILSQFVSDNEPDMPVIQQAFPELSKPAAVDDTDGIRITLENADIVHIRPSGNAPELRCYTESTSVERAQQLNQRCMEQLAAWRKR